jgi:hypothetical protein
MGHRPKTGEPRTVRQPLKIDRLPLAMQDKIRAERIAGRTWQQIELDSPAWPEWTAVDPKLRALFPAHKLPETSLIRWYDIRVEQRMKEVERDAAKAKTIADSFASRTFDDITESAKNALAEQVFSLTSAADAQDGKAFRSELGNLLLHLAKLQRAELDKAKVQIEQAKLEAKKDEAIQLQPRDLYLQAALDMLKRLRARRQVREALDPIRDSVVAEFAHAADEFAEKFASA